MSSASQIRLFQNTLIKLLASLLMCFWDEILPNILFIFFYLFVMLLRLLFLSLFGLQFLIHNLMSSPPINLLLKLIIRFDNPQHFLHFLRSLRLIHLLNIFVMFLSIRVNLIPIEGSVLLPMLLYVLLILLPFLFLDLLVLFLLNLVKPFIILIFFVILGNFLLLIFRILLLSISQVFGY